MTRSYHPIGHRIVRFESVDSTNTLALTLAAEPDAHGTIVTSRQQTAGRGQYGRTWISSPDDSLLLSAILKPPPELKRPVILTAMAAVALGDAILALTGMQARIKWPNDLLIRGKKVCGVLLEAAHDSVVVGIGLNVNQTLDQFEAAGLPDATSLSSVANQPIAIDDALSHVVDRLNREWERLIKGERVPVEADWKWRIGLLGRPVAIERHDGQTVSGRLMEMSFDAIEVIGDAGIGEVLVPESIRHIRAL